MKTLTLKSKAEEKLASKPLKGIDPFTVSINLVTLFIAMGIAYILLFPLEPHNKDIAEYHASQQRQLSEVGKGLAEVKGALAELKENKDEIKDANWQKLSKSYHLQLLTNIIKNKIIAGDDFKSELEELAKFGVARQDINFQVLQKYAAGDVVQIKTLIASLYDEATGHNKDAVRESFIDSMKHFFTNLFTVKKVEEHKIHATSNEITSIIIQLLLDGRIEAAYTVANKFHGAHASITKIADSLKAANDALLAASKLEGYGL